jgi:fumarate hydratase class I
MDKFTFQEMFPLEAERTEYRRLTGDHVSTARFDGAEILKVAPEALTLLARRAFTDVAHLYRPSHLKLLAQVFEDPESSANDRYVALEMMKNAVIAAEMVFPMCQDTGTAIVIGKKGQRVFSGDRDEEAISRGVFEAYTGGNLRYSQNAPLTVYEEVNTRCNLPAQVELYAVGGGEYRFLFIAKGGGSANKSLLFQETKAVLNPKTLVDYMTAKMRTLGTAPCPPYHLAFVIGGTSAELTLKTVKLASAGYLDGLPTRGSASGHAFRDLELEAALMQASRGIGLGAQFGGKWFCLETRVIRLPRHGASCPIGLGVSCSADRNVKGKITREGVFLEQLETDPARFLPAVAPKTAAAVPVDLNRPMAEIRAQLSRYPVATPLLLSGRIVVARDIAHAKLNGRLERGEGLPDYFKNHIVYYAGPAKIPAGFAAGAFGPTTAGRMDVYVPVFQAQGASLVMLAKGNRTRVVTDSCQRHGGFYLGSIGGTAARFGKECITAMDVLEYPELGMEAVYMITVKDFPAFIVVDDKGNDFFETIVK